jgi:hypothetical protein
MVRIYKHLAPNDRGSMVAEFWIRNGEELQRRIYRIGSTEPDLAEDPYV